MVVPEKGSPQSENLFARLEEVLARADLVVVASEAGGEWVRRFCGQRDINMVVPPLAVIPPTVFPNCVQEQPTERRNQVALVMRTPLPTRLDFPGLRSAVDALDQSQPKLLTILGALDQEDQRRVSAFFAREYSGMVAEYAGNPTQSGRLGVFQQSRVVAIAEMVGGHCWTAVEALACGCGILAPDGSEAAEIAGPASIGTGPTGDGAGRVVLGAEELVNRALARSWEFSWARHHAAWAQVLAARSPESPVASSAVGGQPRSMDSRLTGLVWYSPLPPSVGGVSRYSLDFLRSLSGKIPIQVRWTDRHPDGVDMSGISMESARDQRVAKVDAGWLPVYNIQNNLDQGQDTYEAMLREPGLTILHDLNIHPFLLDRHRRSLGGQEGAGLRGFKPEKFPYFQELKTAHGPAGEMEARNVITAGLLPDLHARRCHRLATLASAAVVVHSDWSARQLRSNGDSATIETLPLGIEHPLVCDEGVLRDLRAQCGVRAGELVVVCAGILGSSRQIQAVLFALAQAELRGVRGRLVLCGAMEPGLSPYLRNEAARLGYSDRLVELGEVPDSIFSAALHLADVVVHLHHPSSGQTSSTVLRAMSVGRPVVVSDCDSFADLPDDIAWKVPTDNAEVPVLTEYLAGLGRSEELRAEMGRRALNHIRSHHTWDRVADRFMEILSGYPTWLFPRRPPYRIP